MMHRNYVLSLLALFVTGLNAAVSFTTPTASDVWVVGEKHNIAWTKVTSTDNPGDNYLSVRLYQVFQNGTVTPNFQYLIQQAVPNTVTVDPAGWQVTLDPSKGLNSTLSNKYILALYLETQTGVLAQSPVFAINNITSTVTTSSSSSSASSTLSTSTTSSGSSSTAATNAGQTSSPPASSSPTPETSSGLSTGAKAGIGIGAAAAVIFGLALGWFIFGRRKNNNDKQTDQPYAANGGYPENGVAPVQPATYYEKPTNATWQQTPALSTYSELAQDPQMSPRSYNATPQPVTYAELPDNRAR